MGPSQSVQVVCREFTDVDQRNTWKVGIWYPHGLARAKRSFHRLLIFLVKTSGFNKNSKIEYPILLSAIKSMPHSAEIPVPVFEQLPYLDVSDDEERSDSNDADFEIHEDSVRRGFDQHELNDLARDLGISKKTSEIPASRLNEKNILEQGVKVSYFRTRESTFLQYFRSDSGFVFCHDIPCLLKEIGLSICNPNEWRMFIDSSKRSLKCVPLHNSNLFGAVPLGILSVFVKNMEM